MRGVILGVVAAAGVAGAVVGFLQAGSARSAEAAARGRAAALEADVAGLRKELEFARDETRAAEEIDTLRSELAKAKANLDLAKQSMIDLQAAAREADEGRYAAGERAKSLSTADWVEVGRWSGKGMKKTETFRIGSREWRLRWLAWGEPFAGAGILSVTVKSTTGKNEDLAVNGGAGKDTTILRSGPGDFYLDVTAANIEWELVVETK